MHFFAQKTTSYINLMLKGIFKIIKQNNHSTANALDRRWLGVNPELLSQIWKNINFLHFRQCFGNKLEQSRKEFLFKHTVKNLLY